MNNQRTDVKHCTQITVQTENFVTRELMMSEDALARRAQLIANGWGRVAIHSVPETKAFGVVELSWEHPGYKRPPM